VFFGVALVLGVDEAEIVPRVVLRKFHHRDTENTEKNQGKSERKTAEYIRETPPFSISDGERGPGE
jgi:hypothetical protein